MINKKFKVFLKSLTLSLLCLFFTSAIYAQSVVVAGKVTDGKGPLPGVSVSVKGGGKAVVTDMDGNYKIDCTPKDVLVFGYMGFVDQEVSVGNKTVINASMKEDSELLDEVIVIAYGTTAPKGLMGAVNQVKSKAIEDRPVANLTQALQGASPNLVIQQRSSNPNDNQMNINIRGVNTMNSNQPLLVVDGIISDFEYFNRLNPSEIDNISILKDAGSAAIYGSRSGTGVILVTTKHGAKNSKTVVRFNGGLGVQTPHMLYSPVAGYHNAVLKNISKQNVNNTPAFSNAQIEDLAANPDSEWLVNDILKPSLQQNYNMSVSGGTANTTYLVSAGYFNQQSNYVGPDYGVKRYNVRSNISTEFGRFKLTSILAYTKENNKNFRGDNGSLIADAIRVPTYYYYKMKTADGRYLKNDILSQFNSLGRLEAGGYDKHDNDFVNTITNLDVKIIDGLILKGSFGADVMNNNRFSRSFEVPYYANEEDKTPSVIDNSTRNVNEYNRKGLVTTLQALLDYNKTFGPHTVSALLGTSHEGRQFSESTINMEFTDPDLGVPSGETIFKGTSTAINGRSKSGLTSIFGRGGYNFDEKYYAEFSLRYDGSSKFIKENRWGLFYSVSGSWRLTQEKFMDFYKSKVGDLKFRATYGVLGNQSVGDYAYMSQYGVVSDVYGFNNASVAGLTYSMGNPNLTWEEMGTFNVGLDASFLKKSLNVSFDYFNKNTRKILIQPAPIDIVGTGLPMYNNGEMRNQGWEFNIAYHLTTGKFNHDFGFNMGDSWNKVLKFNGREDIRRQEEMYVNTREGIPFESYFGYRTAGYFQTANDINNSALPVGANVSPGDLKFADRNGDGKIDDRDRYVLGNAFPRYTFGFTYNLEFKGFDFGMLIQGVGKRDQYLRGELVEPFHANYSYVIYKHQLDTWTPVNPNAAWPRLVDPGSASSANNYGNPSDFYIFDASYLRLKNVQLGYTIPKSITSKIGVEKVRAYVNAQNLLTLNKNSFIDPESTERDSNMRGGANSGRAYPFLKYYGFGLDIQF